MKARPHDTHYMLRYFLIGAGWCCVVLGILGIFLPLLPTTIFLLIATWCFARSSERFHHWLIKHPKLGPILHSWQNNTGITPSIRNRALAMLWLSLLISMAIVAKWWIVLLLCVIGCSVSVYLIRLPLVDHLPQSATHSDSGTAASMVD